MRTVGTAERAAFQTIFHRYVSPHSRVIKNKGEKFIFRNEAAMSSQVKVIRTMSGDKIAITLLLPYQSCGILLFDSLVTYVRTANHDDLVLCKILFYSLMSETANLFKTGCCFHYIALLYFVKVVPANWRLTRNIFSPTQIFTHIWRLASVNFRPWIRW